jgi:membrane fusion protein (multidrug efflux system)
MKKLASLLILPVLFAGLAGCGKDQAPKAAPPAAEVTVVTLKPEQAAMNTELPGRTTAYVTAEVRPQVGGILQKRLFEEGTEVKAGQPLYQIAPDTFQATVDSAQAALAKAQAALASAQVKADRYKELAAIEAVSKQSNDESEAAYKQALADVASSRASVASARLSLGFTRVIAPISGRIGRSSVTQGALVTASQETALATVQQLDPIYVDVTQSSTDLLRIRRDMASGKLKIGGDGRPTVKLTLEDGSTYAQEGKLLLAEVTVEKTAGTVTLRAIFPNPKRELLPGMYVRATMQGAVADNVLLVPQTGVSRDARGNAIALVVGAGEKVEQRSLETGQSIGGRWLVVKGLNAGDRVIVEGSQKVRVGAPVRAVEGTAVAAGSGTPAAGAAVPSTAPSVEALPGATPGAPAPADTKAVKAATAAPAVAVK